MSDTILDRLAQSLASAREAYDPNILAPPVALLWPDKARAWGPAIDRLRERMRIVTLADFDPKALRGPAYWLRCVVTGSLPIEAPEGVPVVYLPGVAREDVRIVEGCNSQVAPIAHLQFRSQWFSHPNGRDWSVRSFLVNSDSGLSLRVAEDSDTATALAGALPELLDLPLSRVAGRFLDASFCNELLDPDLSRSVLDWLDGPAAFRDRKPDASWNAFVQQARAELDLDPDADGELTGARKLGEAQGPWAPVWNRYIERPQDFPNVPNLLRAARPPQLFTETRPLAWPQDNEDAEERLRSALKGLATSTPEDARGRLRELWLEHRPRLGSVWAELDRAPLAFALEHLARLADLTERPIAGDQVEALAAAYGERGWQVDDAVMKALRCVPDKADRNAVATAIDVTYRPWLDQSSKALQSAVGPLAEAGTYAASNSASTDKGVVTLFVDGLRLDVAHGLAGRLEGAGLEVDVDTALAPLPTVTPTAKPVLTPVPSNSLSPGQDLGVLRGPGGAKASIQVLRSLMAENGVQVLSPDDTGNPAECAWVEVGEIDRRGHESGLGLVEEVERELERIGARVRELLDAGWQQVDVTTDHGWLLLPGQLTKSELPAGVAVVKKGRCARLKEGAQVGVPTVPWYWDSTVRIALAPGATCFEAGQVYEHGGVSLQECVVPRMTVKVGKAANATGGPEITKVTWLGLLCRVEYKGVAAGAVVDIRGLPGDGGTSIARAAKETTGEGRVALVVPDEQCEGEEAYVVVLSPNGSVLAQAAVSVGLNR